MRFWDDDSFVFYQLAALFGVAVSFGLSQFAAIPVLYSVGLTIPLCMLATRALLRLMERRLDRRSKDARTPIARKDVLGLGVLQRLPDHWNLDLVLERDNDRRTVHVTFEAGPDGPSEREIEIVWELKRRFFELEPAFHAALRIYFEQGGAPDDVRSVDLNRLTLHLDSESSVDDMELAYGEIDPHAEMAYVLVLRRWEIIDVYGAD